MTSRLNFLHNDDFSGGLVTNQPPCSLKIEESPDLDNINLLMKGFYKRQGDSVFNATAMNSGANIQGLSYFKPSSGTEYLVTICGAKIYKSELDGTMDEITDSVTVTANQNNIWQSVNFNDLSIWIGGAPDAPFKYSGSGNAAALGGSPPSGTFGFQTRNRVFIGAPSAAQTTLYWSVLANPEDWSSAGSGNLTLETNDGDKLVGGIGLNNNVALLFKTNSIHQMVTDTAPFPTKPINYGLGACGKNAIINTDGLCYFISNEPRMYMTDGYSIKAFPTSINNLWDSIPKARLPYIYGVHYRKLNQIHWYVSMGSAATKNNYCIIWDLVRECWLRNTVGFDCNVATTISGMRLFGGHYDGKIYEKDYASKYTDDSETSPGKYSSYIRTPWLSLGSDFIVKHPRYFDLNFNTQTSGVIKYSYGFNFDADGVNGEINQTDIGGKWDVDTWDGTLVWGGQTDRLYRVFTYGRGNNFQLKIYNDQNYPMSIDSYSLAYALKGIKEITNV